MNNPRGGRERLAPPPRVGDEAAMPDRLARCVTLNTWKNEGDCALRLPAMAAGLAALAPDIVLLQECFRTADGAADTARALAGALGLAVAYAPARAKTRVWQGREVPSESGHAVLVRGAIAWAERLALPSDEAGGERIALFAAVDLAAGGRVLAACIHLAHRHGDRARRRQQLETVLAHPAWHEPADLRVLGGDCNAPAEVPELAWLAAHPDLAIRRGSPETPTHPLPPGPDRVGRCIDHLFFVGPASERGAEVAAHGVALAAPHRGVWPSDHAAVWADAVRAGGGGRARGMSL